MSHELRTPLNVVVGFADVLRDGLAGPLDERQQSYVEDIAGSGRDLLLLVDELLDVTKVETGALELALTRVDIAEAVADADLLVRGRARESGVTIQVSRPANAVLADADALRIRQIAWNLLGNAVKYSPKGGTVHVTVTADDTWVRVAVRDDGPGIDLADHERIFEPYEQGPRHLAGSGIGLALSRRLIVAHGGHLQLESTPGHGSTFEFALPADGPRSTRRAPPRTSDRSPTRGPSWTRRSSCPARWPTARRWARSGSGSPTRLRCCCPSSPSSPPARSSCGWASGSSPSPRSPCRGSWPIGARACPLGPSTCSACSARSPSAAPSSSPDRSRRSPPWPTGGRPWWRAPSSRPRRRSCSPSRWWARTRSCC